MGAPKKTWTLARLAVFWHVPSRTISEWRALGAPLTEPAKMGEWWEEAHPDVPLNPSIQAVLEEHGLLSIRETPAFDKREVSSAKAYQRLLEVEAELFFLMREHQKAGELSQARTIRGEWAKIAGAIGSNEAREIKNAIQRGDLIPRETVDRDYQEFLVNYPDVLRAGIKEMRAVFAPSVRAATWDVKADKLVDELLRTMPERLAAMI